MVHDDCWISVERLEPAGMNDLARTACHRDDGIADGGVLLDNLERTAPGLTEFELGPCWDARHVKEHVVVDLELLVLVGFVLIDLFSCLSCLRKQLLCTRMGLAQCIEHIHHIAGHIIGRISQDARDAGWRLTAKAQEIWRVADGWVEAGVVGEGHQSNELVPVRLTLVDEGAQHLAHHAVPAFDHTIYLRVVRAGPDFSHVQKAEELGRLVGTEAGALVVDDRDGLLVT